MYEDAFEAKFLKATEALYHEEGNRYMQETDVSFEYCQVKHSDTPQLSVIKVSATLQDRPGADRCSVNCFYKNAYKPLIF